MSPPPPPPTNRVTRNMNATAIPAQSNAVDARSAISCADNSSSPCFCCLLKASFFLSAFLLRFSSLSAASAASNSSDDWRRNTRVAARSAERVARAAAAVVACAAETAPVTSTSSSSSNEPIEERLSNLRGMSTPLVVCPFAAAVVVVVAVAAADAAAAFFDVVSAVTAVVPFVSAVVSSLSTASAAASSSDDDDDNLASCADTSVPLRYIPFKVEDDASSLSSSSSSTLRSSCSSSISVSFVRAYSMYPESSMSSSTKLFSVSSTRTSPELPRPATPVGTPATADPILAYGDGIGAVVLAFTVMSLRGGAQTAAPFSLGSRGSQTTVVRPSSSSPRGRRTPPYATGTLPNLVSRQSMDRNSSVGSRTRNWNSWFHIGLFSGSSAPPPVSLLRLDVSCCDPRLRQAYGSLRPTS
mmetsp:Transcript_2633/g.7128  ORF Transcript_2633/g.7128 Transcript_2633/m.7128 type:complete len:414 (+) Transcript_2633:108-1349(+)